MAKINQNFLHDIFKFLHKPIRDADKDQLNFLERYLLGPQAIWEEKIWNKINEILILIDPNKTPQPRLLKDHVGLTKELNNITNDISDIDLRKLIFLAVALWKTKGTEPGYINIIRIFTGSESRLFNWFDFRLVVGEIGFGEEQLGEDSWLISVPGIEAATPINTIVGLWSFEHNTKDRSLFNNNAELSGNYAFVNVGFVSNSNTSLWLKEGFLKINNSPKYDFSGDFTIEVFLKTNKIKNSILFQKKQGTKEMTIEYKTITNEIVWTLSDGSSSVSSIFIPGDDLDDGVDRHLALSLDKTKGFARIWYNGTGGTKEDISSLGDLTNTSKFLTSDTTFTLASRFEGFLDNLRISTNSIYDVDGATIIIPSSSFIEFIEEQLDEFFTDIRVVDNGSLNRTLLKRIINLMRPISERINIIYLDFYTNFSIGKGNFSTIQGSSSIINDVLILESNTIEHSDIINDINFQDIVLQIKFKIILGNIIGIRFHIQNTDNYYLLQINSVLKTFQLFKVVASIKTSLTSPTLTDIVSNVNYFATVSTFLNTVTNETNIKIYHDRNRLFDILDTTYQRGKYGIETSIGTKMNVDEIESFKFPLDVDVLFPNIII